jgi:hypothetical protein
MPAKRSLPSGNHGVLQNPAGRFDTGLSGGMDVRVQQHNEGQLVFLGQSHFNLISSALAFHPPVAQFASSNFNG